MFLHAFVTWLLANLLHPLVWFIYLVITGVGNSDTFNAETVSILVVGFFYSLIFSLPCLVLSMGLLQVILSMKDNLAVKFFAWLFAAALLIFLEVWVIILLVSGGQELELLLFSVPPVAATWLSITIRLKQFKNLIHQLKPNDHEDIVV